MHLEKTCEYNIQLTEEKSRAWRENGNIPLMRHTSFLIRLTPDMLNSFSMARGDLARVNITGCNFLRFHEHSCHLFQKPRPLTRLVCSRTNGTARHVVSHMKEACCQVKIVSHKLNCQSTRVSRVLESVISCASEEFLWWRATIFGLARIINFLRDVAQPGRAHALGAWCRQFESGRPDHFCGHWGVFVN